MNASNTNNLSNNNKSLVTKINTTLSINRHNTCLKKGPNSSLVNNIKDTFTNLSCTNSNIKNRIPPFPVNKNFSSHVDVFKDTFSVNDNSIPKLLKKYDY